MPVWCHVVVTLKYVKEVKVLNSTNTVGLVQLRATVIANVIEIHLEFQLYNGGTYNWEGSYTLYATSRCVCL